MDNLRLTTEWRGGWDSSEMKAPRKPRLVARPERV